MDPAMILSTGSAGNEVKTEPWRRKAIQDLDQEAKARRRAHLEQRHLEAYWSMHHLRDALHRHYAALLKDKVRLQRLALQQRHETAGAKSEKEMKKQKKLSFSKLQHDDSYLESLPKTSFYLIFDLQNQLAQRGYLKTHQDLEDFYRHIKYNHHPSKLQRSLQDVRGKMLDNRSAAGLVAQQRRAESLQHPCADGDRGHEDHISYTRLLQVSGSGESSAELIFSGSQEKDETEQMFPKVSVKTTGAVIPLNTGDSERQTHLEQ